MTSLWYEYSVIHPPRHTSIDAKKRDAQKRLPEAQKCAKAVAAARRSLDARTPNPRQAIHALTDALGTRAAKR